MHCGRLWCEQGNTEIDRHLYKSQKSVVNNNWVRACGGEQGGKLYSKRAHNKRGDVLPNGGGVKGCET